MPILAHDDVVMHGHPERVAMSMIAFVIWMSACERAGSQDAEDTVIRVVQCVATALMWSASTRERHLSISACC